MVTEDPALPPPRDSLLARIRRGWARDSHLSLKRRLQKGLQMGVQLLRARSVLRTCNRVGANARVAGRMRVDNRGTIVLGKHLNINSSWVATEFLTGPQGRIDIGDDVLINFGTLIAAGHSVCIGSGSMIGPHCIICDVDNPELLAGREPVAARPIQIGRDVWLAGRVTIRPGVRIGDGAVIVAGSIVESDVPANVMASGIPARLLPKLGSAQRAATATEAGTCAPEVAANSLPVMRIVLATDLVLDDLAGALEAAGPVLRLECVRMSPSDFAGDGTQASGDYAIVWVGAEAAVPSYGRLLAGALATDSDLERDAVAYANRIAALAGRYRQLFLPTWTFDAASEAVAAAGPGTHTAKRALLLMNWALARAASTLRNVELLDAAAWGVPSAANAARAWYLGGMAVTPAVQIRAAHEIRDLVTQLVAGCREVVILVGHDALAIDAASAPMASPERRGAYSDFVRSLVALRGRGVRLAAIAPADCPGAADALARNPAMTLAAADFAAWRAGSDDLAGDVARIAGDLGVATNRLVVLDARPDARQRLAAALPDVLLPPWPDDVLLYPIALAALRCLDAAGPGERAAGRP